ncbi:hypothetical protein UFOVP87_6 [uncultured Caudovirales phage]|uniref:Phage protein D n=1 Tax=uncultured Caudovirales phage TaxID=2100421 RepID=A0A6J5KZJ4_9CAUD|nr:hypothetical protein UFOVP87_6 [uncultured Caudovirales phage]
MLLPRRKITFTRVPEGDVIEYTYVASVSIEKSTQNLTNTATIVIPRKLRYSSGEPLSPSNQSLQDNITYPASGETVDQTYVVGADAIFKRGDKVKIEMGYYPNLTTRFNGYISHVSSSLPIEIKCENEMWLLKQFAVIYPEAATHNFTTKQKGTYFAAANSITLKQLMDIIISFQPSTQQKIRYKLIDEDMNIGKWLINNITASKVLDVLKDRYGLYSYFKDDGILYVGFPNDAIKTNTQEFTFEDSIINADTLNWENAEDARIKIHGVSMLSDNTKLEYDAGDEGGDTITKICVNQNQAGLEKFVKEMLAGLKYTGYRGSVKTFGEPVMNPGDVAKIISRKLPERNGNYLIKSVKVEDSTNGQFQTFELGVKVA